jgi:hypothetical protein
LFAASCAQKRLAGEKENAPASQKSVYFFSVRNTPLAQVCSALKRQSEKRRPAV